LGAEAEALGFFLGLVAAFPAFKVRHLRNQRQSMGLRSNFAFTLVPRAGAFRFLEAVAVVSEATTKSSSDDASSSSPFILVQFEKTKRSET
jgi:hypothetical protein